MSGETNRIVVAEAGVKSLRLDCTVNQTFEIINKTGKNEIVDNAQLLFWQKLFIAAQQDNSSVSELSTVEK